MQITLADRNRSFSRIRMCVHTMLPMLILVCLPLLSYAQQPTATISVMNGEVLASGTPAQIGTVLRTGDTLETGSGAEVVLELSDGSRLELGENTKIDIAQLLQTSTGARVSRIKLFWGRIRSFLSAGHQKQGSSFNLETPNALVGVKFSQPDVEVIYNFETNATIIIGYTVAVNVTSLVTKEVKQMPKGHQAIVQDEFLWIAPITPGVTEIPPEEKQRQTRMKMLLQSRQSVGRIVSTVPMSARGRSETSQSPGSGTSVGPRPRTVIISTSEE